MFEFLFLDLDDTILDFQKAERVAISRTIREFGVEPTEELRQELLTYCSSHIDKYAMPREIEFRKELPKTLVGKVAYRVLEEEANAQLEQGK